MMFGTAEVHDAVRPRQERIGPLRNPQMDELARGRIREFGGNAAEESEEPGLRLDLLFDHSRTPDRTRSPHRFGVLPAVESAGALSAGGRSDLRGMPWDFVFFCFCFCFSDVSARGAGPAFRIESGFGTPVAPAGARRLVLIGGAGEMSVPETTRVDSRFAIVGVIGGIIGVTGRAAAGGGTTGVTGGAVAGGGGTTGATGGAVAGGGGTTCVAGCVKGGVDGLVAGATGASFVVAGAFVAAPPGFAETAPPGFAGAPTGTPPGIAGTVTVS